MKIKMNKLLAKWTLSLMMTLSATIRAFFWFIRNGLIHFVMDPSHCRSSESLAPSLRVWNKIRTCICWPIVLISQWVELDLISLIYVIKVVEWIDKACSYCIKYKRIWGSGIIKSWMGCAQSRNKKEKRWKRAP